MVSGSDLGACQLHIDGKLGSSADSEEEEDDDENCGFCIFMKAGGCKKEFTVSSPQLRTCKTMCMRLDFWHEGSCCNTLKPSQASCSELTNMCNGVGMEQVCGCKAWRWAQLHRGVQRAHHQPTALHGGAPRLLPGAKLPERSLRMPCCMWLQTSVIPDCSCLLTGGHGRSTQVQLLQRLRLLACAGFHDGCRCLG